MDMVTAAHHLSNVKQLVKIPIPNSNPANTPTGVYQYEQEIMRNSDVQQLTHIVFDKLDNVPLNFALEIHIGGQLITSISNEIIGTDDVQSIGLPGNTGIGARYRIKLPFDKMWVGRDIHHTYTSNCGHGTHPSVNYKIDGIVRISLQYYTVRYKFKTTNQLSNISLVQEENYLENKWRKYLAQNSHTQSVIQIAYTHGMSNEKIILEHGGQVSGYYIHCRQPITRIKMSLNENERHNLDEDLIAIQCQRVNAYTLYMPCSLNSQRFVLNTVSGMNHSRIDSVVMQIETADQGSRHPVCIISEIHREFIYERGMGGVTTIDGGQYIKNLTFDGPGGYINGKKSNEFIPAIPRVIPEGDTTECVISKELIEPGMEYSRCIRCVGVYAYEVMQLWWNQNKSCPYCRIPMPSGVTKYINSEPNPNYVAPEPEPEPLKPWEIPGVAI